MLIAGIGRGHPPSVRRAIFIDKRPQQEPAPRRGAIEFRNSILTPKGSRRSAQGCRTRLPWETDDDAQPQRGYGSVPHTTLIPLYVVRRGSPKPILLTVKVATLSGLERNPP